MLAILLSFVVTGASALQMQNSTANSTTQKKPMNFVFYFPDTLRAESFSSYGYPLKTTPHVDEFAKTAVRFEQAHSLHTQCAPSRVAMLTGRYMHVMNHRTQFALISEHEFNYFRAMKNHGYHIQYYGKNDAFNSDAFALSVSEWTAHQSGMPGGTAVYTYPEAGWFSMLKTGADVAVNSTQNNGDMQALHEAAEWMKNDPPQPFVLFLATLGAHPPYGSPKYFNDKWAPEDILNASILRPAGLEGKPKYHSAWKGIPFYRNLTALNDTDFAKIQATYLGMISYVDWMFGRLLESIDAAGLRENTAVIFSSDHGDFAGDFGMVEKWPGGADDVLTRVPLYMRVPGMDPAAKGFVAQGAVSLMDVPHTMALLAGIDVTDTSRFGVNFGTSLAPQVMQGLEGDVGRYVYAEGGFSQANEVFPMGSDHVPNDPKHLYYPRAMEEMSDDGNGSPRWVMIRNATHKLVYRSKDVSELYDYTADPRELTNLFWHPEYEHLKQKLSSAVMAWLLDTSDVAPLIQDTRSTPAYPGSVSACGKLSSIESVEGPGSASRKRAHIRELKSASEMLMLRGTYDSP